LHFHPVAILKILSEVGQDQLLGLAEKFSETCSAHASVRNFPGVSLSEAKQTIAYRFAGPYIKTESKMGG